MPYTPPVTRPMIVYWRNVSTSRAPSSVLLLVLGRDPVLVELGLVDDRPVSSIAAVGVQTISPASSG